MLINCGKIERKQQRLYLLRSGFVEDAPEPQRLVTGTSHYRFAVGRHGQIEDAVGMARQLGHLRQTRILPNQNLIL